MILDSVELGNRDELSTDLIVITLIVISKENNNGKSSKGLPNNKPRSIKQICGWCGKIFRGGQKKFFSNFNNATEDWFYQEIDGKPYVICVAQGDDLEQGYANYDK